MRQNSIQNRLQMISMEEYLEKRQKIRETERKRDKKQSAGSRNWMLPLRWQSCMFNRRTLLVRVGVIRMRCTGKECIDI